MKRPHALATIVIAVFTLAGCSSSTALEGEKFYIQSGVGRAFLPRDIAAVNEAAKTALTEDLGYELVTNDVGGDSGLIEARTAGQWTVKVQTWSQGPDETKLQISMGRRGGDGVIRSIMSKIEARLQ